MSIAGAVPAGAAPPIADAPPTLLDQVIAELPKARPPLADDGITASVPGKFSAARPPRGCGRTGEGVYIRVRVATR